MANRSFLRYLTYIKTHTSNKFEAICRTKHEHPATSTCGFYLKAILDIFKGMVTVWEVRTEHNCVAFNNVGARQPASNMSWLLQAIPRVLSITTATPSLAIKDAIKLHYGHIVLKQQCCRAKKILLEDTVKEIEGNFLRIPAYLERLKHFNYGVYTHFETDPQGRFSRVFICPPATDDMFQCLLPWIAIDATWLKLAYKQTLQMAVGRDGNNRTKLLCWQISEGETKPSWHGFFHHMGIAIPSVNQVAFRYAAFEGRFGPLGAPKGWPLEKEKPRTAIINDRNVNLLTGIALYLFNVNGYYCCWHLAKNIVDEFGKKAQEFFWTLVYCTSREIFRTTLDMILAECGTVSTSPTVLCVKVLIG